MQNLLQDKPTFLTLEELKKRCSLVGLVDDTVMDLWKSMTPMPYGERRILFPSTFLKWAEQARLYY